MSLQSLYSISALKISDSEIEANITFDPGHKIFEDHFPGQAVVPGVCLIRIVKNVISKGLKSDVLLLEGSNIKFLHILDPGKHPRIHFNAKFKSSPEGKYIVTASLSYHEIVFLKFAGSLLESSLLNSNV